MRNMTFRDQLAESDRESLKDFAYALGLTRLSKLKKAEIFEKVAETFLDPKHLYWRLAILDDEAMTQFVNASKAAVTFPIERRKHNFSVLIDLLNLGGFDINDQTFLTYRDIWEIYVNQIEGEEFEAARKTASWIWKCLRWMKNLYGIVPERIALQVVNLKKGLHLGADDLLALFSRFPADELEMSVINGGYADSKLIYDDDAWDLLQREQSGKPFYIPTIAEIEEYYRTYALLSRRPYQEMLRFLKKEMLMNTEEAERIMHELWRRTSLDDDSHDTLQWFVGIFESAKKVQVEKALLLYNAAHNGTCMIQNRGYAPSDMPREPLKPGQKPTVVPASSVAAKMLLENLPEIQKMGFNVDFDSNAREFSAIEANCVTADGQTTRKVYPNDPCPCGSGKKFKKCCGRG